MSQRSGNGGDPPTHIQGIRPGTPTSAVDGAQGLEGAESAQSVDGASPDALESVSRALAAGEITQAEAQSRIIEAVLQLPADVDPAVAAALREELEDLLADDPTLARLLATD